MSSLATGRKEPSLSLFNYHRDTLCGLSIGILFVNLPEPTPAHDALPFLIQGPVSYPQNLPKTPKL